MRRAGGLRAVLLAALVAGAAPGAPLDDAAAAIDQRRYAEALEILAPLTPGAVGDPVRLGFLRALALMETGAPDRAVALLEPVVARRPRLVRVRLELARAYFLAGEDARAERQFRQVLGGDLPPAVRRNVLGFLERIEQRRRWRGTLRAAIAPDTNVTSGTDARQVILQGVPFDLDEISRQTSGVGIELSGTLARSFGPAAAPLRPRISGSLFLRDYLNDRFDDVSAGLSAGLEAPVRRGRVYGGFRSLRRHVADQPYAQTAGAELQIDRQLAPRLRGFGQLVVEQQVGLNRQRNADALLVTATGALSGPLDERLTLAGIGTLSRRDAGRDGLDALLAGFGLELSAELPAGFRFSAGPAVVAEFRDRPSASFGRRENRVAVRAEMRVTNRLLRWRGFSPSLALQATRQFGEVATLDYARLRLLIGAESAF